MVEKKKLLVNTLLTAWNHGIEFVQNIQTNMQNIYVFVNSVSLCFVDLNR